MRSVRPACVVAVRRRRAQHRGEPPVEHGGLRHERTVEREVVLREVADGKVVVAVATEAVAPAVVELDEAGRVAVLGIGETAAVRGREPMRPVRTSMVIVVDQPGLPPVRMRHPAEHVVEGPVLHQYDDDVVDPA